jgi:hypothetical protein
MKTDQEKGLEIVRKYRGRGGPVVGKSGSMEYFVAELAAKGITLGRKEGIAMAAAAVARLKDEN